MSEYSSVEKPFLDKLRQIGWNVIDHGNNGIPQDPTISKRTNFDDWAIKSIFSKKVKELNPWITEDQINQCWDKIITQTGKLLEVNESTFLMLRKGITLEGRNVLTPKVWTPTKERWKNGSKSLSFGVARAGFDRVRVRLRRLSEIGKTARIKA